MDDGTQGAPGSGIHVRSSDSSERARLIASVRACGVPYRASASGAELVLMGVAGTTPASCADHAAKHPELPFALCGERIAVDLLEAAEQAGVLAILSEASPSRRFAVELRRTRALAAELSGLRRWAADLGEGAPSPFAAEARAPTADALGCRDDASAPRAAHDDPVQLAARLRRASEHGDFELAYQPKVNADTRRIVGFEALIRWQDEVFGRVSPEVFVPVAEELGLIEAIGQWCIEEASAQLAAWTRMGLDAGRVAVNASPIQFQQPDFARRLIDSVTRAGIDPARFELEITEGCLLESDRAIDTLRVLAESGIHIAVDDFGTGYSSLQYLRRLPIHCLKIDRVFVTDLATDPSARSLTAAIISLAWNLGLRVVAEGVEDEEQWRFLADHGCDEIQGYRFSGPLTAAQAEAMLRDAAYAEARAVERRGTEGETVD